MDVISYPSSLNVTLIKKDKKIIEKLLQRVWIL